MNTSNCFWDEILVVMSGGVDADGKLPINVVERCKVALKIVTDNNRIGLMASSSFSLNVPPKLDNKGFPISESSAIFQWFRQEGYQKTILCEQQSHDTVGSIFFILYVYARILSIKKIKFVTNKYHLPRVNRIAYTINRILFKNYYDIEIIGVEDRSITDVRLRHEQRSLDRFLEKYDKIDSPEEFALFFFGNHKNYNQAFKSDNILSEKFMY